MATKLKIAVTGSNGFIGSQLVEKLENLGHQIIHLDISKGIDITDWKLVKNIEKFDVVYHLAAMSFVPDSYIHTRSFYQTNIISTINILELCRIFNSKIVFTSSYVYGKPEYLPIDENHPLSALNPYAQSKIICEQLCIGYSRDFGINSIIIRPFNIYGKNQSNKFLIPTIIRQARTGSVYIKDSIPRRDYIFIDDLIEAYIGFLDYHYDHYDIFNVGTGISYSVREVTEMIVNNFNTEIEINYSGEKRRNEIMETTANIKKINKLLGWTPKISLNEGLKKLIQNI